MGSSLRRIVVIGASLAGVHALEAARDAGYAGELTLIGAESRSPYDRPSLSKQALHDGPELPNLLLRPDGWYDTNAIDLQLGRRARHVSVADRHVILESGERIDYDGLVLATGSAHKPLPEQHDPTTVLRLRTFDDCSELHARLSRGGKVAVVGAGFIGLEVAATAAQLGLGVTVIARDSAPLARTCGLAAGTWLQQHHEARGVTLRCNSAVTSIERQGHRAMVRLDDGSEIIADHIVAGIGVHPNTSWLAASGLALGDGVVCDDSLLTSAPDVAAAGDIVRWPNAAFNSPMRVQHWSNAVDQGRHAMRTLLDYREPYSTIPSFWSDQFGAKLRFVGIMGSHSWVETMDRDSLVVLFGANGLLCGALCINATHRLLRLRTAIAEKTDWNDITKATRQNPARAHG